MLEIIQFEENNPEDPEALAALQKLKESPSRNQPSTYGQLYAGLAKKVGSTGNFAFLDKFFEKIFEYSKKNWTYGYEKMDMHKMHAEFTQAVKDRGNKFSKTRAQVQK